MIFGIPITWTLFSGETSLVRHGWLSMVAKMYSASSIRRVKPAWRLKTRCERDLRRVVYHNMS